MSRPRRIRIALGPTLATSADLPRSAPGFAALAGRSLAVGIAFGATTMGPWAESPAAMATLLATILAWALPALAAEPPATGGGQAAS